MKTFELPVSDCGCFVVGYLDENTIPRMAFDTKRKPEFGIIVWYETKEAARAAAKAASDAHWPSPQATAALPEKSHE